MGRYKRRTRAEKKELWLGKLERKLDALLRRKDNRADCAGLDSPCIYAEGRKNASGYPLVSALVLGFTSPCCWHVVSWCLANGIHTKSEMPRDRNSITGRSDIHHICSEYAKTPQERYLQRSCINPNHLIALSHRKNMARGFNATKKICKHGHSLTDTSNIYIDYDNHRHCRACGLIHRRKHYLAHREYEIAKHRAHYAANKPLYAARSKAYRLKKKQEKLNA